MTNGPDAMLVRLGAAGMATLLCAIPGACPAAAAPYSVRLDERACTPAADRAMQLEPAWQAVAAHVQACAVRDPTGRLALTVLIVRVHGVYTDPALRRVDNLDIPHPALLSPTGERLGALPEGFPTDPPGAMRVTFTGWHDGFPWRVELYEGGVSALPPHPLDPMLWNPGTRRFGWQTRSTQ